MFEITEVLVEESITDDTDVATTGVVVCMSTVRGDEEPLMSLGSISDFSSSIVADFPCSLRLHEDAIATIALVVRPDDTETISRWTRERKGSGGVINSGSTAAGVLDEVSNTLISLQLVTQHMQDNTFDIHRQTPRATKHVKLIF